MINRLSFKYLITTTNKISQLTYKYNFWPYFN